MSAISGSSERMETGLAPAVRSRSLRARRRRSFVGVLCGLAAFVALQLGLSYFVATTQLRDHAYGPRLHFVQKSLRRESPRPLTVVMLGTSRTSYGFRPGAVEKGWRGPDKRPVAAFNFGVVGGGPMSELLMWRRLRHDGVRPDLLLVEVLPPLLCGQKDHGDLCAGVWPTKGLRWDDLPLIKQFAGSYRPDLRREWLTIRALPCYFQRHVLMKHLLPFLAPEASFSVYAPDVDQSGAMKPFQAVSLEEHARRIHATRLAYGPYLDGFRLGGPGCEALRELMESCRQERVPAALVLMPEGPAFRSWYAPETLRDVNQWLGQLGRDNDAPVIDAREWFGEDEFLESNHLLQTGADQFTERLGRETILPLLRRQSGDEKPPRELASQRSPFRPTGGR